MSEQNVENQNPSGCGLSNSIKLLTYRETTGSGGALTAANEGFSFFVP